MFQNDGHYGKFTDGDYIVGKIDGQPRTFQVFGCVARRYGPTSDRISYYRLDNGVSTEERRVSVIDRSFKKLEG